MRDPLISETFPTDAMAARAIYPAGGTSPTNPSPERLTIAYDASSGSYTVTMTGGTQSFRPQDRVATPTDGRPRSFFRMDGNVTDMLLLTTPAEKGALSYSYVGGGISRRTNTDGGISQTQLSAFSYGVRTANAAVPITGSASFATGLFGTYATESGLVDFHGTGTASIDFARRIFTLDGTAYGRVPVNRPGYFSLFPAKVTGSGTLGSGFNILSGSFTYVGPGIYSGSLDGRFYGPAADEFGAALAGRDNRNLALVASLLGRRGDTAPALETLSTLLSPISIPVSDSGLRYIDNGNGVYSGAAFDFTTDGEASIDPVLQHYNLFSAVLTPGNRIAAESDARFTTYRVGTATDYRTFRFYNPGAGNSELVLSYASLGLYQVVQPDGTRRERAFIFGIQNGGNLPRTGNGVFNGVLHGAAVGGEAGAARYAMQGTTALDFDWAAATFTGSMSPSVTNVATNATTALGAYTFQGGQIFPMGLAFGASIGGPAGTSGQINGRFYGPEAQEVGGRFSLITNNAATGPLVAAGAIVAKR